MHNDVILGIRHPVRVPNPYRSHSSTTVSSLHSPWTSHRELIAPINGPIGPSCLHLIQCGAIREIGGEGGEGTCTMPPLIYQQYWYARESPKVLPHYSDDQSPMSMAAATFLSSITMPWHRCDVSRHAVVGSVNFRNPRGNLLRLLEHCVSCMLDIVI